MQRDRQTHGLTGNRTDAGPFPPLLYTQSQKLALAFGRPRPQCSSRHSRMGIADATRLERCFSASFPSSETKYLSFSNKPLIDGFKRAGELRPLLLSKLDTVIKLIKPTEAQVEPNLTSSTDSVKDPDKQVEIRPFQLAVRPFTAHFLHHVQQRGRQIPLMVL